MKKILLAILLLVGAAVLLTMPYPTAHGVVRPLVVDMNWSYGAIEVSWWNRDCLREYPSFVSCVASRIVWVWKWKH